jgi:hypothetical protein
MRSLALAAAMSVAITAGSMAAPLAKADIDFYRRPACWGAIAASLSTGEQAIRPNYRT